MESVPCACLNHATRAWQRIDQMAEISLESIIVATTQTIEFALQAQECPSHNFITVSALPEITEVLLRIYAKLVSFFQVALATYTCTAMATMPAVQSFPTTLAPSISSMSSSPDQLSCGQWYEKQAVSDTMCRPSRMTLGIYTLNDEESRYLALDLICRSLRNLAHAVQQMDSGDNAGIKKADSRVLNLLFRVTELLESATAHLGDRTPEC